MQSLWKKQMENDGAKADKEKNPIVKEHYDVIVIGAGLSGLLVAYYLKMQGKTVLVLESKETASGQTEGTTAKITSQHGLKYSKLIRDIGVEKARLYAQANETAVREYEHLITSQDIDCQFERVPAYLYSLEEEEQLTCEAQAARLLGIDAYFTRETELPFPVKGAVCFRNQAQFSPLKFTKYISEKLDIAEHTKVIAIRGNQVITKGGKLCADKIVIASHYPIVNIPGFYFLRQHQERSYTLALSGCPEIKGMYYGIDKAGLSFRQAGEYLLLGGGSHRTGENINKGRYESLLSWAKHYFPDCREIARWSAQDCMPHDGIPFIGKYSVFTPNLYVVTGFQKWGMTSAMTAAMILGDELCGTKNNYAEVFSPQRINFRGGISNFVYDVGMSVKGLSKGWLGIGKKAPEDVTGSPKRCSHMGCELVWNPDEESWDCPCHGSRFNKEGNMLDNPTKKDISI